MFRAFLGSGGTSIGARAIGAIALLALGASAPAQCIGYTPTAGGPGQFVPGATDIGLHADDGVLGISLPFPISFYGTPYSSATVGTNGTLQFTTNSTAYSNVCLPTTIMDGPTIFPFWDDLYTFDGASGEGTFTDTIGSAPNRVFVIEWRTGYCCTGGAPLNTFEVKFYEGQDFFDVVFGTPMADRSSATIGCQSSGTGPSSQFICNTAGPAAGDSIRFACVGSANAGACCLPATLTCTFTDAAGCSALGGNFATVGSVCATANCPTPGACCIAATQTCTTNTGPGCASAGGSYQGNSTSCATSSCPFGACCAGCAGCNVSTPVACAAGGGTYIGNGSTCATAGCTITNGGFESGAFPPGWTQFGDISFTAVNTGAWVGISPHGGGFEAHFGPTGTTGGIMQTIPAHTGDQVTISFWYAALGTPNSFSADFDNQNLMSLTNDTANQTYNQFTFTVTSTSDNPTLMFTTFNPPSYDFLDDITVCIGSATNGACCNNSSGGCTSTTQAGCTAGSTFQGLGTSCNPNPCPQPPSGVCCRGATCTTSITSAAACAASLISGQNAGSAFPISGACNGVSQSAPCCYANYNKVNGITVQDIFDYLQDWFNGSPYAATGSNGTGGLTVQHIFDYLQAWFNGGCS